MLLIVIKNLLNDMESNFSIFVHEIFLTNEMIIIIIFN